MIENGFYIIKKDFVELIKSLGGLYQDDKDRPMFCCFQDRFVKDLFWAIPMSEYSHRNDDQIIKIEKYCSLREDDIRFSYYHIGETNKKAVYRVSSCFPVIDKYIDGEYEFGGKQLVLMNKKDIYMIRKKLSKILFSENQHPNFSNILT